VIIEKDGIKQYIQCKKYITTTVGVKAIREFYGVLVDHASQSKGIFITTNIFSSEAVYFAQGKPIELIDGQKLVRLIRQLKPNTR
jgi:restriction system protein